MSVADDQVDNSRPAGSLEKMVMTVAASTSGEGDKKISASPRSVAAAVHSLAGDAVAAIILPGNAPGVLSTTKLPVDQAGARTPADADGSGNHDGIGLITGSLEGIPRALAATPNTLEIGIQSGTHGWLKVRADMAAGGVVNAAVSSSSSEGQEMLHRELPALTAFLRQEKVAVNAIVVHTSSLAGSESRSSVERIISVDRHHKEAMKANDNSKTSERQYRVFRTRE